MGPVESLPAAQRLPDQLCRKRRDGGPDRRRCAEPSDEGARRDQDAFRSRDLQGEIAADPPGGTARAGAQAELTPAEATETEDRGALPPEALSLIHISE